MNERASHYSGSNAEMKQLLTRVSHCKGAKWMITVSSRHLSVTESVALPPNQREALCSIIPFPGFSKAMQNGSRQELEKKLSPAD